MAEAVVIGDLELDRITGLAIDESRKLVVNRWPGADGDIVQDMGMAAARIALTGIAAGDDAGARIEQLRKAIQSGQPQDFAASAAAASNIEQVMVVSLKVSQPPGRADYYDYAMELIRYVPPPPPPSGGFDLGALGDIASSLDTSALAAIGDAAGALGTLQGTLQAIDDGLAGARSLMEMAENGLELVQGLGDIQKVLKAAANVMSAWDG